MKITYLCLESKPNKAKHHICVNLQHKRIFLMINFLYRNSFNVVIKGVTALTSALLLSCTPQVESPDNNNASAYISEVFEYVYAPGQHSAYAISDEAFENFKGEPDGIVYLGGFGGYIIAGFDHNVINKGGYDFEIYALGVMPEPAVVYVMSDENGDGAPNETWHELKGNQFDNSLRDYEVCYYKPASEESNVRWKDNQGKEGELISGFGGKWTASWWWSETESDSIVLSGTRLPDAYENTSNSETQKWEVPKDRFTWGYAENQLAEDFDSENNSNKFDISNAVDENGNSVDLQHIRFIKVQTAVFQRAGWLNEISSELRGAKDLHY